MTAQTPAPIPADVLDAASVALAKWLYDRRYVMSRTAMASWSALMPFQVEYEVDVARAALTAVLPRVIADAEARGKAVETFEDELPAHIAESWQDPAYRDAALADAWDEGYIYGHQQACPGRCTHGVARNPHRGGSNA